MMAGIAEPFVVVDTSKGLRDSFAFGIGEQLSEAGCFGFRYSVT